ncbi:MAG TPA: metalloprotease family protein [Candidatus Magasanikbacteria bacterium]|nr:metalloprotease family protein [Candidatus Magasanikbacteria bacterium]
MIPGWLISLLTFPGVIIHEWAHKKFCDWTGVTVHKVVYFRFGNPAGYVMHEKPEKYKQIFWISIGPLIINSVLAIFLGYFAILTQPESLLYYLIFWVAISSGMHAFPSDHDAKNIFNESKNLLKNGGSNLHYLAYPFYSLIWIANKLRFIWFDLWYAIALVSLGGLTF